MQTVGRMRRSWGAGVRCKRDLIFRCREFQRDGRLALRFGQLHDSDFSPSSIRASEVCLFSHPHAAAADAAHPFLVLT